MRCSGSFKAWRSGRGRACIGQNEGKGTCNWISEHHLNCVTWGVKLLPGQSEVTNLPELLIVCKSIARLRMSGFITPQFSKTFTTEYRDIQNQYEIYRASAAKALGRVYFPNVSVGWDSTPRTCQTDNYRLGDIHIHSSSSTTRPGVQSRIGVGQILCFGKSAARQRLIP